MSELPQDRRGEHAPRACSHTWIDPSEPPISRTPIAPIVGPKRRHMKPGRVYRCRDCPAIIAVAPPVLDIEGWRRLADGILEHT